MSEYKGKPAIANINVNDAYLKLCDLKALQQRIEELPDEQRDQLQGVTFSDEAISFTTPMGEFRFVASEKIPPERIAFAADGSPIPLSIAVNLKEESAESTSVNTVIDADLPFFVKTMVGGKLKEVVEKINLVIAQSISNHA